MVLNCFGVSLEISNAHKIEVLCGNSLQSDSSIELSARVQPFLIHHVASSSAIRAQIFDLLLPSTYATDPVMQFENCIFF